MSVWARPDFWINFAYLLRAPPGTWPRSVYIPTASLAVGNGPRYATNVRHDGRRTIPGELITVTVKRCIVTDAPPSCIVACFYPGKMGPNRVSHVINIYEENTGDCFETAPYNRTSGRCCSAVDMSRVYACAVHIYALLQSCDRYPTLIHAFSSPTIITTRTRELHYTFYIR